MTDDFLSKLPAHKCGLYLTHNEHRDYYETIEQWLGSRDIDWESDEAKQRAIGTDECWSLHWYPDTPIGSYTVAAPTLDECLEFARKGVGGN